MGLGITLTNLIVDALFLMVFLMRIDLSKVKIALLIIPFLYIIGDKIENKYYLNNGRYKKSIEYYEKSYALAWRILNKITQENAVTGASIVPVDISRLRQDDTETADIDEKDMLTVLLVDNQGVYIELGNINNPNNTLLQAPIAEQIFEALRWKKHKC